VVFQGRRPATATTPARSITLEELLHELTRFADDYEQDCASINRAELGMKKHATGTRDANADYKQRLFRATVAIDRVRAYVLAQYGEDLTIETARRLLGDLIRACALTLEAAQALPLETAMDRLDATRGGGGTRRDRGGQRKRGRSTKGDLKAERAFYDDWKNSGLQLREFARSRGIELKHAKAMTAWERTRRNRQSRSRQQRTK
jgi:hypothetical protein